MPFLHKTSFRTNEPNFLDIFQQEIQLFLYHQVDVPKRQVFQDKVTNISHTSARYIFLAPLTLIDLATLLLRGFFRAGVFFSICLFLFLDFLIFLALCRFALVSTSMRCWCSFLRLAREFLTRDLISLSSLVIQFVECSTMVVANLFSDSEICWFQAATKAGSSFCITLGLILILRPVGMITLNREALIASLCLLALSNFAVTVVWKIFG